MRCKVATTFMRTESELTTVPCGRTCTEADHGSGDHMGVPARCWRVAAAMHSGSPPRQAQELCGAIAHRPIAAGKRTSTRQTNINSPAEPTAVAANATSSSYPVITPSRSALPCVIVWPALFACVFTLHRICGGVARRSWRVMPQPGGPRIHSCPPARPCRCWDRSKGRCCPGLLAMHGFGCQ